MKRCLEGTSASSSFGPRWMKTTDDGRRLMDDGRSLFEFTYQKNEREPYIHILHLCLTVTSTSMSNKRATFTGRERSTERAAVFLAICRISGVTLG